mmetsp:Transcript_17606/g.56367  ORF Transcript_17606/g.56367 Transcript_17606/m.56367 type:complete len:472 (+) Transcript_17606:43-1458(+)
MPCSVTLADPGLDDCPLIGCSEGFEALTGYSAQEVVGRNCRFLSRGRAVDPAMRRALRDAVRTGEEFIGVLPNVRKSGEHFSNLLRLTATVVRGKRYVVGVQADVTGVDFDRGNPMHVEALRSAARRIFSGAIDAWVQIQAREFYIRQPVPYSDVLKANAPQQFQDAQGQFVVMNLGAEGRRLQAQPETPPPPPPKARSAGDSPVAEDGAPLWEESTSAASATGGPGEEENADGSRTRPMCGVLRSAGSAGHPDNCNSECIFYFFRDGCRAGQDCRFCHEFHRRKNMKKNRRILRKMCVEAGNEGDAKQPLAAKAEALVDNEAERPRATPLSLVRYWYGQEPLPPSSPQGLTLVVGQRVQLPARVEVSGERGQELKSCLTFSVEPALPAGLVCDKRTGHISGAPQAAQVATGYIFRASIAATGPGGIDLNQVHLATIRLGIGVLDLQRYALCWGHADASGAGLTLKFQAGD